MYHIVQCGHSAACVRLLGNPLVYMVASLLEKKTRVGEREIDRDGLTQKERKVSVILIALVPSSISIVVVKVIYFFVCVKFRYEKKSFFAVSVYISWPALFFIRFFVTFLYI